MKHIFSILLSIILLGTNPACTLKQEAYAVMSPDSTTLTFYYDTKKSSRQGTAYEINAEDSIPKWVKCVKRAEFLAPENPNFTTVVFDESFKDARPVSCAYWFAGFLELTEIKGISNLNTSNVTDMSYMFDHCYNLTKLDMSNFDTSKVKDMSCMFSFCKNLTSINVSSFDTSNVTNMDYMFDYSEKLKTIYAGDGWNTSKIGYSRGMFENCTNLVGGKGTTFNSKVIDITRAKIDGGKANPGYLTAKK